MSIPRHSLETREPRRSVKHWAAIRKHWLFAPLVLVLSPLVGLLLAGDRGLMFGLAVGTLSCFWIWWEGDIEHESPPSQRQDP